MSPLRSARGRAKSRSFRSLEPPPGRLPQTVPERIGDHRVIAPGQLSFLNAEGRGLGSNRISIGAWLRPSASGGMGATMKGKSSASAKGCAPAALAGVVAGLMAVPLLSSTHAVGASGATVAPVQIVDRTRKGDRLD